MSAPTLEQRVQLLEQEVLSLKRQFAAAVTNARPPGDAWRETVGMFRGDPLFREIIDAGKAIRESDQS